YAAFEYASAAAETDPFIDLLQTTKDLNNALPHGVRILESRIIPKKAASLSGCISRYIYEVDLPSRHAKECGSRISELLAQQTVIVEKEGKQKDIRPGIESIVPKGDGSLEIILQDTDKARPRVQDVVEKLFAIHRDEALLFRIKRTAMFEKVNGEWKSPMDVS
ncbi:MAG: DUF2344 domain-containing protein, partial [Nitrospirota bacterium]